MMKTHNYTAQKIEPGDIVVVTHPEFYTFGPDSYGGIVVKVDRRTVPSVVTFLREGKLVCFYEDDLGVVN